MKSVSPERECPWTMPEVPALARADRDDIALVTERTNWSQDAFITR